MRARLREGLGHDETVRRDETVDARYPNMRTARAIAASRFYPTASPVDERCLALVRCGAVWSVENHAIFPDDERIAASSRTLLMGVKRYDDDDDDEPYYADIGPARGTDGVERGLPRDIWEEIFGFLVFAPPPAARASKRRRVD